MARLAGAGVLLGAATVLILAALSQRGAATPPAVGVFAVPPWSLRGLPSLVDGMMRAASGVIGAAAAAALAWGVLEAMKLAVHGLVSVICSVAAAVQPSRASHSGRPLALPSR